MCYFADEGCAILEIVSTIEVRGGVRAARVSGREQDGDALGSQLGKVGVNGINEVSCALQLLQIALPAWFDSYRVLKLF